MSRELEWTADKMCDRCDSPGSFDFMGDNICAKCMSIAQKSTTEDGVPAVYELVGYGRSSDKEVASFSIPPEMLDTVKSIAIVCPEDDDGIGSYPLLTEQAECILSVIGVDASSFVENVDYFLEPHTR